MQAIICNIPGKISISELSAFVRAGVKPLLPFFSTPEVLKFEILEVKSRYEVEYHGLIAFSTQKDMDVAIERLNGQKLYGKPVKVREYHHRSRADHRIDQDHQGYLRPEDRRREDLAIEKRSAQIKLKTSGYDMAKTHGSNGLN
jgi:hypothetical protein